MAPRLSDTRQRMVSAAAQMLGRHGLNATSIRELAKWAEAPLGSTYHHFPGGKRQVLAEAVAFAGARITSDLEQHLQTDPVTGLRGFLGSWRDLLLGTSFKAGCPVLAAVAEEPLDEDLDDVVALANQAFDDWQTQLARSLESNGIATREAGELAMLLVASVEGAIILSRARRDISPFNIIAGQLEAILQAALPTASVSRNETP